MLTQEALVEKRGELDGLCAALGADDPAAAEGVRSAGQRAIACVEDYDEDGAAQAYLDMLGEAPDSLAVHRHVAYQLIGLERTGDALEIAAEAAQAGGDDPGAYVLLGEVSRKLGHGAVAVLAYQEALRLGAADEAGARAALGDCCLSLRRHEQAAAAYERAVELGREGVNIRLDLARAYHGLGRYEDAAESCRQALTLEPECAVAHLVLGYAFAEAGHTDEAAAALRRCQELGGCNYGGLYGALGRAFESLGLCEEADAANSAPPNLRPACGHCAEEVLSRVWPSAAAASPAGLPAGVGEAGAGRLNEEEIPY